MQKESKEVSKIVEFAAVFLFVPILTYGLYIITYGHLTPGGGFQGGTIIATAFALLLITFGKSVLSSVDQNIFLNLESAALVGFIGLAFLGLLTNTFFFNFLANTGPIFGSSVPFGPNVGIFNSAGVIPFMNLFVGLEVCCGLTIIIFLFVKGVETV
ncbi:MAG: MnhB domain-containing protein [Candidatus Diapherotrites archaeon]